MIFRNQAWSHFSSSGRVRGRSLKGGETRGGRVRAPDHVALFTEDGVVGVAGLVEELKLVADYSLGRQEAVFYVRALWLLSSVLVAMLVPSSGSQCCDLVLGNEQLKVIRMVNRERRRTEVMAMRPKFSDGDEWLMTRKENKDAI